MRRSAMPVVLVFAAVFFLALAAAQAPKAGDAALGTRKYDDYQTPQFCGTSCHVDIYRQWQQAMMSQAYTHHWDEIEYFKLAVPHAEKDSVVAGVKAGCNGCHAPDRLSRRRRAAAPARPRTAGPTSPSPARSATRSTGFAGDTPYNFNFVSDAGQDQVRPPRGQELAGARPGQVGLPRHGRILRHLPQRDEPLRRLGQVDPPRVEGRPLRQAGRQVPGLPHDLRPGQVGGHGQRLPRRRASTSSTAPTTRARSRARSSSASTPTSARRCPANRSSSPSPSSTRRPGHKFPTGSVEDRIVWMHVEAMDSKGNVYHLPVDKKGFAGEEYTIGADTLAYQDMGIALNDPDFKGAPAGRHPRRRPHLPHALLRSPGPHDHPAVEHEVPGVGLPARAARDQARDVHLHGCPTDVALGELTVTAVLNYQKLVKPVADFLGVPPDEAEVVEVNRHATTVTVVD